MIDLTKEKMDKELIEKMYEQEWVFVFVTCQWGAREKLNDLYQLWNEERFGFFYDQSLREKLAETVGKQTWIKQNTR